MTATTWVLSYLLAGFVLYFIGVHTMYHHQGKVILLSWWADLLSILIWPLVLLIGTYDLAANGLYRPPTPERRPPHDDF